MSDVGLWWRYLRSSLGWWFGLAWGLVGTVTLVALGFVLEGDRRFREEGVAATATVIRTGHDPDVKAEHNYFLRYRYRDNAGQDYVIEQAVNETTWRQSAKGSELTVVYLPAQPSRVKVVSDIQPEWVLPGIFLLVALVFAGPGWYVAIRAWRNVGRRLRVLRDGVAVLGRVTGVHEKTNVTINDRHPLYLSYQFLDADGEAYSGDSSMLPLHLESRWAPGDPILVLHDANNPDRHEVDIHGMRADDFRQLRSQAPREPGGE